MEYINGEPMCYACMAMGIQEEQTIRKDYTAQQKQVSSQTSVRTDENAVASKSDDTDSTANHREVKYN
jgi:hypothetical protein